MPTSGSLEALNQIQMTLPDLICLDVNMPAGNGLSVAEMIQTDPTSSHVPIIILTGRDDPRTIRRCHDLCVYYVIKGGDVWSRIEPLLIELLDLKPDLNASEQIEASCSISIMA